MRKASEIYGDHLLPQVAAALRAVVREAIEELALPQAVPTGPWTPVRESGHDTADIVGAIQVRKWQTRPEESRPDYRSTTFLHNQAPRLFSSVHHRPLFNNLLSVVASNRRLICRSALSWMTGDPNQKGRPSLFLNRFVIPFLIEYFALARPEGFDEEAFDRALDTIEMDLPTPLNAVRLLTPLVNVWLWDDSVDVAPGIRLKRVSASDIERWLNMKTNARLSLGYVPEDELLTVQCALEVTAAGTANETLESALGEAIADRVVAVLRLLLSHRVFPLLTEYQVLGLHWIPLGYRPHWAPGYRFDMPAPLDRKGALRVARLFDGAHIGRNRHSAELALRRWSNAWERARPDDALIDYWVALESLFVPENSTSIKWLASSRIAAFLEKDEGPLQETFVHMIKSYKLRSDVVHADRTLKTLPPELVEQMAQVTGSHLRRALIAVLESDDYFSPIGLERKVAAYHWASADAVSALVQVPNAPAECQASFVTGESFATSDEHPLQGPERSADATPAGE